MPSRFVRYLPVASSIAVFVALMIWGIQSNWIQYKRECEHGKCMFHVGESVTSIQAALYYQKFGAQYWYLQMLPGGDLWKQDWIDQSFVIYTHNPNIGGFLVYATALLGFQTVILPAIITAFGYSVGIFLAFRFGKAVSNSDVIGSWFGFFMATDFFYNLSYGLNLIRGWSWLGLMSYWYAVVRLLDGEGRGMIALLAFGGLVTLLVGLDIFMLATASAVLVALIAGQTWRARFRVAALIVGVAVGLFAIRQMQIMGALGFNFWITDIYYTAGLKIPYELRWFEIPNDAAIDAWYGEHKVIRGHASTFVIRNVVNWIFFFALLDTWRHMWLSLPIFGIGALCTLTLVIMRRYRDARALQVLLGLILGTAAAGMVLFAHFTGYFVKLAFPYMTALVYLALAIAVAAIWQLTSTVSRKLAIAVMTGVLVVWTVQQVQSVSAAAPEVYPNLVYVIPYRFYFCPPPSSTPVACS